MSMVRWSPFFRGPGMRGLMRPLVSDLSRIDTQIQHMNREMDRIFEDFHRSSPFFTPSFYYVSHLRDYNLMDASVTEKDGKKHLQFHFDVSSFKPEEIDIKTKDGGKTLEVYAKHEDKSDSGTVRREYHRILSIPSTVDSKQLECMLSPEGVLSVSAPIVEAVPEPKMERRSESIPLSIKHECRVGLDISDHVPTLQLSMSDVWDGLQVATPPCC